MTLIISPLNLPGETTAVDLATGKTADGLTLCGWYSPLYGICPLADVPLSNLRDMSPVFRAANGDQVILNRYPVTYNLALEYRQ